MEAKTLFDYNDVFADLVNVLLYQGRREVSPADLEALAPVAQEDDTAELYARTWQVARLWKPRNICFALLGLEGQRQPDRTLPIRLLDYTGRFYQRQLDAGAIRRPIFPVVLYFGNRPWAGATSLYECLTLPKEQEMRQWISDYQVRPFDVAELPPGQAAQFRSDFAFVAATLSRRKQEAPPRLERWLFRHPRETVQFMLALKHPPLS